MPGPGKYFIKVDKTSDVVRAWLFNFEVSSAVLKKEHRDMLDQYIAPVLKDGGTIKLLGLASTTGSIEFDKKLSGQRIKSVEDYLNTKIEAAAHFKVSKEVQMGKLMAMAFFGAKIKGGTADNVEDEVWRGVVVNAWNRDLPPPPPVGIDTPFTDGDWATNGSTILDTVGLAVTFVDMVADLTEIAAVTAATGPLGLIITCLQGIAAMPLLFHASDAIANTNGQIQGQADAIQDMCDQFKDPSLRNTPLSKWPKIQAPATHLPDNPHTTANQDAWRGGQIEGRNTAVKQVLELENNPKPVTLPSGKHVRINGKTWLFAASQNFKDNCGVELVIKPVNERLKKDGRPPFPTR